MAQATTTDRPHVKDVVQKYGNCLQLVGMDPHFHEISIGLYEKGGVSTVWTFSRRPGVQERIDTVVDRLVRLGGMERVSTAAGEEGVNQVRFPCGYLHDRPLRFLMTTAVEKAPDTSPQEEMSIKDSKSPLTLHITGEERDRQYVYRIAGEGDAKNPAIRLRAILAGFLRYGEMEKVDDTTVRFPCGQRHDELLRLILPYSRNISAVEEAMEAQALRGQMTTQTLGFSST